MTGWLTFTPANVKKNNRNGLMIVSRFNAKAHIGIPVEITDRYVALVNGPDMEMLYYEHLPASTRFQVIEAPGNLTFGIAEHRLPLV